MFRRSPSSSALKVAGKRLSPSGGENSVNTHLSYLLLRQIDDLPAAATAVGAPMLLTSSSVHAEG